MYPIDLKVVVNINIIKKKKTYSIDRAYNNAFVYQNEQNMLLYHWIKRQVGVLREFIHKE